MPFILVHQIRFLHRSSTVHIWIGCRWTPQYHSVAKAGNGIQLYILCSFIYLLSLYVLSHLELSKWTGQSCISFYNKFLSISLLFYHVCCCDGLFSFIVCWVLYGSHIRIRYGIGYGTDIALFLLLLSVNVICDLYFDSHILVVLIITLIFIHIISIKCVYVRECY